MQSRQLHANLHATGGYTYKTILQCGRQSHANWTQVAATRMQIDLFLPILHTHGRHMDSICLRLAAKRQVDVACIAASRLQNLHALAAITLQSRQFFAMTLGDQLFE